MAHTWREIAEIWTNNLKGTNKEWIPVGSNSLANALLEARAEFAQLEAGNEQLRGLLLRAHDFIVEPEYDDEQELMDDIDKALGSK